MRYIPHLAAPALLLYLAMGAPAQPPTLSAIDPSSPTAGGNAVNVTLTGTGFSAAKPALVFLPSAIIATNVIWKSDTTAKATFTIRNTAPTTVSVSIQTVNGVSPIPYNFSTGVVGDVCVEAIHSTECNLRWEVDATGITGSSTEGNNRTTPTALFKLDWLFRSPKDTKTKRNEPDAKRAFTDRIAMHLIFEAGYTQATVANQVQPTANAASAPKSESTVATAQPAFEVEAGGTLGWTLKQNGQGTFAEIGLGARGSFQDIIPNNQIVQNGGLSYIDLGSANLKTTVGLYEATAHFKLLALGHDVNANTNGDYNHNVSDFIVIEAGYQNNSGLQGLITTGPSANTRNRFVGRFYAYPEISSTSHTKLLVGMEFSSGINGGPKVVQLVLGTNVNPAKLFHPDVPSAATGNP
jgi:hypothetical protein